MCYISDKQKSFSMSFLNIQSQNTIQIALFSKSLEQWVLTRRISKFVENGEIICLDSETGEINQNGRTGRVGRCIVQLRKAVAKSSIVIGLKESTFVKALRSKQLKPLLKNINLNIDYFSDYFEYN